MSQKLPRYSLGSFSEGAVCYMRAGFLTNYIKENSGVAFQHGEDWCSIRSKNTTIKNLDRWGKPVPTYEELGAILEECSRVGVKNPSGFGDIFHRLFGRDLPRGSRTVNSVLSKWSFGPWEEEKPNPLPGEKVYDLRSAYASAALKGLPHKLFHCLDPLNYPGVFVGSFSLPPGWYPRPLRAGHNYGALSTEEMEAYGGLWDDEPKWGVSWKECFNIGPHIEKIRSSFKSWKRILRAFWGAYGGKAGPLQITFNKGDLTIAQKMRNIRANFAWSHMIQSRPKIKLWTYSAGATRVHVDSLRTVRKDIPLGNELGDFRIVDAG